MDARLLDGLQSINSAAGDLSGVGNNPLTLVISLLFFALLPFLLLSISSFVKLSVVFGILRNALGAGQIPSTAISTLLSLVLSVYIMGPVAHDVVGNLERLQLPAKVTQVDRLLLEAEAAGTPIEKFLRAHSNLRERLFFVNASASAAARAGTPDSGATTERPKSAANALTESAAESTADNSLCEQGGEGTPKPELKTCRIKGENLMTLVPSFLLSELSAAFVIGFTIFLPFLVIDLVVANLLVGLGMMMVSPTTISTPLKIILFVLCDGWFLLSKGLILGYW